MISPESHDLQLESTGLAGESSCHNFCCFMWLVWDILPYVFRNGAWWKALIPLPCNKNRSAICIHLYLRMIAVARSVINYFLEKKFWEFDHVHWTQPPGISKTFTSQTWSLWQGFTASCTNDRFYDPQRHPPTSLYHFPLAASLVWWLRTHVCRRAGTRIAYLTSHEKSGGLKKKNWQSWTSPHKLQIHSLISSTMHPALGWSSPPMNFDPKATSNQDQTTPFQRLQLQLHLRLLHITFPSTPNTCSTFDPEDQMRNKSHHIWNLRMKTDWQAQHNGHPHLIWFTPTVRTVCHWESITLSWAIWRFM